MSKKIHILHSNNFTKNEVEGGSPQERLTKQFFLYEPESLMNFDYRLPKDIENSKGSSSAKLQPIGTTNFEGQTLQTPNFSQPLQPRGSEVSVLSSPEQVFSSVSSSNIRSRNILRLLFTIIYGVDGTAAQNTMRTPILKPVQVLGQRPSFRPLGKKIQSVIKGAGNDVLQTFSEGPSWRVITVFGVLPIFLFFGTTQTSNYVKILQNSQTLTTIANVPPKMQQTLQRNIWFPATNLVFNSYQFQDHLLRIPDYLSKIFVAWGLLYVWKGVRPQRKMFKEGGNASSQTRIIWPNQPSGGLRRFLGLHGGSSLPKAWALQTKSSSTGRSSISQELKGLTAFRPVLETLIQSLKTEHRWGVAPVSRTINNSLQMLKSGNLSGNLGGYRPKSYAPKGYLFVGPPGTGKTLLAQALAREANVPLLCVSASEIQKQIEIGTRIGALRLRKLFDQARRMAPCILFLDEIDAIGRSRGNEERTSTENLNRNDSGAPGEGTVGDLKLFTEFLIQMDSFPGPGNPGGFVVIGTTNFLASLDSAFIRSGRFDRILGLNYPSKQVRVEILQWYSKTSQANKESIPWNYFGHFTEGFSPADLSRVVNESLLAQAVTYKTGAQKHTFESLQKGFNRISTHKKYLN